MAFMKFYVGNEANASSHRDGIYIAINTKKIFYNGDVYGGSEVDLSNYATLDDLEGYLPLTGGTMKGNITFESIPVGNVGDAVLYDKQADKLIIVPTTDDIGTKYPSDNYEPIGVVVIPASHDVYGTGECGVMSLKAMTCDSPSTGGTSQQYMIWGVSGTNISGLPDLDQVPTGNTSNGIPTGSTSYGCLPSDKFRGVQCAHDTDAYYYDASRKPIPSPYLTDGSRNPGYYQTTSPSSSSNALADFDGIGNTAKIITQRGTKDYNSWTPDHYTAADYPAASCCDMFYTEGTSQGDWYLPACGELGYIFPTFNKINEAIDKMRTAYGSSVGVELLADGHWSSSEHSSDEALCVSTSRGDVGSKSGKSLLSARARAFLRVLPTSNSKGIIILGKSNTDLLNAAGSTTTLKTINNNSLLGSGNIELLTIESIQDITGSNTYTGANYISKETNLTEAVLQLDEEIKATNDNLALEHTNAEATYAKKTELGKKLDISTYTSDKATFALKSDIPNVSNFLTISNAQSTYLTKTDASNIYQPKGSYLTSVSIATISDLNANWDALLKSDPSGYVTRWPNMSEVGSKQNLVIKLNGGTTEGTNQFTYNVTAAKSINITPSSIGAAASSHTHTASQVSGLSKVATSGSYNDLTNKPSIPSAYTLPKATTSTLGGIKVGDGLEITGDGTLNCIIDPGSGTVSWGNIQGKPSVFATNIASINDLNSGWDALLKAAPNIPSLNGYATQAWVNGRGFLTKTTADGYYQPKGNYLTSVSWSQISGKPEFAAVATSGSYNDLTNKPTIPSLTGYATQSWVNSQGFAKGSFLPLTGGTISGNLIISNAGDDKNVHINANTGITLKGTGVGISLSTGGSSSKFFATDGSVQTINVADFALKSTTDTLTNITNSQDQRISNMKLGMARYISGSTATVINGDEGMVGLSGTPALYFYNGGISTDNVPIRNCIRIQGGQCYVDNNGIFITLASISTGEIDELFN